MQTLKFPLIVLLLVITVGAEAQMKIGIKFSPGITATRGETTSDTLTLGDTGSGLRFLTGVVLDYQFAENYYFSSGINFVTRKASYTATGNSGFIFDDEYNSQYIQVPLSIKLYTNEIALDKKIYFQLGGSLEFNVDDNLTEQINPLVTKNGLFDTSIIVGAGLEMGLGTNTAAFGGLTFQRGMLDFVSETQNLDGDFNLKNTFIGLEVGVKF